MRGTPVLVNKLPIGDFIADLDFSDVYILTLTRDLTIDIKNAINGVKYTFIIKQDNTGGRVLFKRGDTFYGSITINQAGLVNDPITFGAYGAGSNPIITLICSL